MLPTLEKIQEDAAEYVDQEFKELKEKLVKEERERVEARLVESVKKEQKTEEPEVKEKDDKPKKSFEERIVELDIDELVTLSKKLQEERQKEFNPSAVKNELSVVRMLVNEAVNIHCQIEQKAELIQNDKKLSPLGKNEELKKLTETSNATRGELRKQAAKLQQIMEAVETEAEKQCCLDEAQFDCTSESKNEKKLYSNFSEAKLSRLRDDFRLFGTIEKPDKNGNMQRTYRFGWLLQKYMNACSRNDAVTQFFCESMLPVIEDVVNYRSFNDKDGVARTKLKELVKKQRASRIDPELLGFSDDINYLKDKIKHIHTLAKHGFISYDSSVKQKYFKHMKINWQ